MTIKSKKRSVLFIAAILASTTLLSYVGYVDSQPEFVTIPPSQESVSGVTKASGITNKNCLAKCPAGTSITNIVVDHDAIVLSSNRETKFADWVAYLSKTDYIDGPKRDRKWAKDPEIGAAHTFMPEDYKNMSTEPFLFDRGHQAPLASFKNHPKWYVVNYLSNITPQKKYLNRGPWQRLEAAERTLVKKFGEAYVMTGPYYDKKNIVEGPSIKRITYTVPSGYWKIIAIKEGSEIRAVSFSFPQNTSRAYDYCKALVPLANIKQFTGLEFFDGKPVSETLALKKDIGCGASKEY